MEELTPGFNAVNMWAKESAEAAVLSLTTRNALSSFFRPYNNALYEYLGRDFQWE
jgi:hypothetical protein